MIKRVLPLLVLVAILCLLLPNPVQAEACTQTPDPWALNIATIRVQTADGGVRVTAQAIAGACWDPKPADDVYLLLEWSLYYCDPDGACSWIEPTLRANNPSIVTWVMEHVTGTYWLGLLAYHPGGKWAYADELYRRSLIVHPIASTAAKTKKTP